MVKDKPKELEEISMNELKEEKSTEKKIPKDLEEDLNEDAIVKLEDLNGIGPRTAEKLRDLGYTVLGIATGRPDAIAAEMGQTVSYSKAKGWVMQAQQAILSDMTMKNCIDYDKEKKDKQLFFHTGSNNFNMMVSGDSEHSKKHGGGIPTMSITGLTGRLCHSEDTQVISMKGEIKEHNKYSVGDYVLRLDNNGKLVETEILRKYVYDYEGEMIEFVGKRINLKVTPKHTVYFSLYKNKLFNKIEAEKVFNHYSGYMPVTFDYEGKTVEEFDIHKYINVNKWLQYPQKSHIKEKLKPIEITKFLRLLGWYLSHGSIFHTERSDYIQIRVTSNRTEMLRELLESISLDFSEYEEGTKFVIFHQDLAEYMMKCGVKLKDRSILPEILELDKPLLKVLFDAIMIDERNKKIYSTPSETLRKQFCILLKKIGLTGSYRRNYVNISYSASGYVDKRENIKKSKYKGKVWCYETTTGNFFTVRNGIISLSGNSSGKSQICFDAIVDCIGRLNKKAVFIETEPDTFHLDRLKEIAKYRKLDCDWSKLSLCPSSKIPTIKAQFLFYKKIQKLLEEGEDIVLVVIDSFNAKLRAGWSRSEMLPVRSREVAEHFNLMEYLSSKYNLAWLITCQAIAPPRPDQGLAAKVKFVNNYYPVGGDTLLHSVQNWIALMQVKGDLYKAALFDSSHVKKSKCEFMLTKGGISDGVR